MKVKYPGNKAVCETDEQWAGRNMLRDAFLRSKGMSKEYEGTGPADKRDIHTVIRADRPLYWYAESPETKGRQYFSPKLAERDAKCVRAFLEANGVNVTAEQETLEDYLKKAPWTQPDLVRVYGTGTFCDPYATDPATVAMLPGMEHTLWNLVRLSYEEYKF